MSEKAGRRVQAVPPWTELTFAGGVNVPAPHQLGLGASKKGLATLAVDLLVGEVDENHVVIYRSLAIGSEQVGMLNA